MSVKCTSAVCGREFETTPEFLKASGGLCPTCLIAEGAAPAVCEDCHNGFLWYPRHYRALGIQGPPKRCPKCLDENQGRPQIALERRELWAANVKIGESAASLLRHAVPFQTQEGDRPSWRLVVKGQMFGAEWSGRINVYLHLEPNAIAADQIVSFSHMEVKAKVWMKHWERPTMEYGVVDGYRRCLPGDEGAEEREETTQYVSILPTASREPVVGTLVWAQAYTKTTLKGFGRQYWAHLEGSPLWQLGVTGGARSGRFHTDARLAVVEEGNPLIHVHRENGREDRKAIAS